MAAQSSIILADGQATPVNHTFEPNGAFAVADGVVKSAWYDRTGHSLEIGRATLREDHRPSARGSREKTRLVVEVPVVESVVGVMTKVRMHAIDLEVRFDPGALQAERDNVAAYLKALASSAYVQAKLKTGERTW